MIQQLPAIVRQVQPDVLFFPSNGLMAVAAATRLRMGKACPPMILRPSNSLARPDAAPLARAAHRFLVRRQAHIYAAIVAMAEPVRGEIIAEMDVAPDKVVTIDNAALTADATARLAATRDATPRSHKGRRFLSAGRLAPQKNFMLLLDAFARIAGPDDRLTILGDGGQRAALERKAQALGIADRLDMPGHQIGIERWLAQTDAFVLSSDFEGFGNVIVEALAAGVPVVATDCCTAIPMLVGDFGRLVPIRDVGALAQAMDTIGAQAPEVAAMRAHAARFTMDATVGQWLDLFARVATERHDD